MLAILTIFKSSGDSCMLTCNVSESKAVFWYLIPFLNQLTDWVWEREREVLTKFSKQNFRWQSRVLWENVRMGALIQNNSFLSESFSSSGNQKQFTENRRREQADMIILLSSLQPLIIPRFMCNLLNDLNSYPECLWTHKIFLYPHYF